MSHEWRLQVISEGVFVSSCLFCHVVTDRYVMQDRKSKEDEVVQECLPEKLKKHTYLYQMLQIHSVVSDLKGVLLQYIRYPLISMMNYLTKLVK
jgi:hypothetical protein